MAYITRKSPPVVVIDCGHGGRDTGVKAGGHTEAELVRGIGMHLYTKFKNEGKVTPMTTFGIAGKNMYSDDLPASERRQILSEYIKKNQKNHPSDQILSIDQILSLHLESATDEKQSGLVICHNNIEAEAWTMYNTMAQHAWMESFFPPYKSYNIKGNMGELERVQNRPNLAALRKSILDIFKENGVKIDDAKEFLAHLKEATDSFKMGASDISLYGRILTSIKELLEVAKLLETQRSYPDFLEKSEPKLLNGNRFSDSEFLNKIKLLKANQPYADKKWKLDGKYHDKETKILEGISAIIPQYDDHGDALLLVRQPDGAAKAVPALLIKAGFVTNKADRDRLALHPDLYANWIGEGAYKILDARGYAIY